MLKTSGKDAGRVADGHGDVTGAGPPNGAAARKGRKSSRPAAPRPTKRRKWLNRLPEWVVDDPAYATLKAGVRRTLEVIAHRADAYENGDLLGAVGGRKLMDEIGIGKTALWEHVEKLEALGFVVTVNRGGGRFSNVYSIPGCRGGLDGLGVSRRATANGAGGDRPTYYDTASHRRVPRATHPESGRLPSGKRTPTVRNPDGSSPETGHSHPPVPAPLPSPSHLRPGLAAGGGEADAQGSAQVGDQGDKADWLLTHFAGLWQGRYGRPYQPGRGHLTQMTRILRAARWDLAAAAAMVSAFLADGRVKHGHHPKLLTDNVGPYQADAVGAGDDRPAGTRDGHGDQGERPGPRAFTGADLEWALDDSDEIKLTYLGTPKPEPRAAA